MTLIIGICQASSIGTNGYITSTEVEKLFTDVLLNVTMIAAAIILFGTILTAIMEDFLILEVN